MLKPHERVFCACGCGQTLRRFDSKGKERRYINGHYARRNPVAVPFWAGVRRG